MTEKENQVQTSEEEAKFYRDKHILETKGHSLADGTRESKATAMAIGISPENYDKIIGIPKEEEALEKFKETYEEINQILDYYMDMPENHRKLVTIWILGTYLHQTFPTYPFLFINAMRGSGKTRLLKLISHLAFPGKGMVSTQPSDSVLFRTPKHNTLVFDEFENIGGKDKANFRLYLNASYKTGGVVQRSKRVKKEGSEGFEIETFEPYKPIAMANIWGMEEVVEDRCLTLILQKSNNPGKTKIIEDFERNYTIQKIKRTSIRNQCSLCSVVSQKEHIQGWNEYIKLHYTHITFNTITTQTTLSEEQKEMFEKIDKTGIDGRNLELIFPLLITAKLLNNKTFEEILNICVDIIKSKKDDEFAQSRDVSFIDFIANNYGGHEGTLTFVSIKELHHHFKTYMADSEDFEDKWIDPRWIGRALKRLDLTSDRRRTAQGVEIVLNVNKAKKKLEMFKEVHNPSVNENFKEG